VSGRSRAESQVGVRLMGVWRVSYSNIQEFFFTYIHMLLFCMLLLCFIVAAAAGGSASARGRGWLVAGALSRVRALATGASSLWLIYLCTAAIIT
jgi:hypothetical protein